MSAWYLRDLRNPIERDALLVAFSLEVQSSLIDQSLTMFTQLYHSIFKRAKIVYSERFFADGKTINQHLRQYVALGKLLTTARLTQQDAFQAIDETFSWDTLVIRTDDDSST